MKHRCDSIRLGPGRCPAVSLSDLPFEPPMPEPSPRIDWELVLEQSSAFDADEREYLLRNWIDRLPRRALAEMPGWNAQKVERVRKRVARKLESGCFERGELPAMPYSPSGVLHYHETLPSGHRAFGLTELDAGYLAAMTAGTRPKVPVSVPNWKVCPVHIGALMFDETQSRLREAKTKFDGLIVRAQEHDRTVNRLESDLAELQRAASEAEIAVLLDESQKPDPALSKKIAAAEKALDEANRRTEIFDGAIARQRANVEALQAEVAANRYGVFRAELDEPAAKLARAIDALTDAAIEASAVLAKHGRQYDMDSLFPVSNAQDAIEAATERGALQAVYSAALGLIGRRVSHGEQVEVWRKRYSAA